MLDEFLERNGLRETAEGPQAELDSVLTSLMAKHSLQGVAEALKRVAQAEIAKSQGLTKFKWQKAEAILANADRSLFGQHCGDVYPSAQALRP